MEKYIKSITAMNDLTISMSNRQEVERYAESDCFWAANKQRPLPNRTPKKGMSINLNSVKISFRKCPMSTGDW